jgi:hypothetical protein
VDKILSAETLAKAIFESLRECVPYPCEFPEVYLDCYIDCNELAEDILKQLEKEQWTKS